MTVEPAWSLDAWRTAARDALHAGVPPDELDWDDADRPSLLGASLPGPDPDRANSRVPRALLALAERVLAHRDPHRHALLYRLTWRWANGEPTLLSNPLDADVQRAHQLEKAVRRDMHKMKAFVRFRALPGAEERFVAWFEPEHRIVDLVAPFFARRFAGMRWAILTPYRSVAWDGQLLSFGAGATPGDAPGEDAQEALWQAYYAHIFNPARLNPRMMRQEMPQKYWKHLPETHRLPTLIRDAGVRVREMAERDAQSPRKPAMVRGALAQAAGDRAAVATAGQGLGSLEAAARACRACPLWQPATQTVWGEGPVGARVMVVGEQPGDAEDLSGRPFVGPAGRLLDRALQDLGIDRAALYLTNAVKHFKFELRGKRRLHRNPAVSEQHACAPWLREEIRAVRPGVIVCLGATAARAVLGPAFALMDGRGRWQALEDGTRVLATVHPAWVLRQPAGATREAAYRGFVADLSRVSGASPPDASMPP